MVQISRNALYSDCTVMVAVAVYCGTVALLGTFVCAVSQSHEKILYDDLFNESLYTPKLRPRAVAEETLEVTISFELSKIQKLNEVDQILHTSGFVVAQWTDDYLSWDPVLYWDIDELIVPPSDVWLPDFGIINSVGPFYEPIYFSFFRVHISNSGHVVWDFGGDFSTRCQVDLTFFPFDSQACDIVFENWAYPMQQVSLTNASAEIILDDYHTNGEWDLTRSHVSTTIIYHDVYPDLGFPKVIFTLHIMRKSGYYSLNILTPCFMIVTLALLMFWLPADSGEKVSLGITVLLAFSVFQLIIAESTPRTSDYTPLLSMYVTFIMGMACVSTMVSIVVLYFNHHLPNHAVPPWAQKVFFRVIARAFGMQSQVPDKSHVTSKIAPFDEKILARFYPDLLREREATTCTLEDAESFCEGGESKADQRLGQISAHLQYIVDRIKSQEKDEEIVEGWKALGRVVDRIFFWLSLLIVAGFMIVVIVYSQV